jgi:hypothetical protein
MFSRDPQSSPIRFLTSSRTALVVIRAPPMVNDARQCSSADLRPEDGCPVHGRRAEKSVRPFMNGG